MIAAGAYVWIRRRKRKQTQQVFKEQGSSSPDQNYEQQAYTTEQQAYTLEKQGHTAGRSEMHGEATLPVYESAATERPRRHELGVSENPVSAVSELHGDTRPWR